MNPSDTLAFVTKMLELGVPCELHLFQRGPHGQALYDETSAAKLGDINAPASTWVSAARMWMRLGHEDTSLSEER